MESLRFELKNKGLSEYNDDVYDHAPFIFEDTEYDFIIQPGESTSYWRFGLAFSKTFDFDFLPNSGRYKNTSLCFIQLNVGDYKRKTWTNPHKLELQTYYFPEYTMPVHSFLNYKPRQPVSLKIFSKSTSGNLELRIKSEEIVQFDHSFDLKDFRFFKVFAWADEREFKILCELDIYIKDKFTFPLTTLSNEIRRFLEIIYQKFLSGERVENYHDIPFVWNEKLLRPDQISPLILQNGTDITLWGIWLIDPESDIFGKFDRVIYAIRKILSSGKAVKQITSEQIQLAVPNITNLEIRQIFRLMGQFTEFHRGMGTQPNMETSIIVEGSNQLKDQYKDYEGLQKFLDKYLRQHDTSHIITDALNVSEVVSISQISALSKTRLQRKHRSKFKAVLGVQALAQDMAGIIDDLPDEPGQMIGIFGKWGRGKSFLMDEMVKKMKESKKFTYIPVTYHAWKYQETPSSWAYLYEILADEYFGKKDKFKTFFRYHWKVICFNYKKEEILPLIYVGITIILLTAGWIAVSNTFKPQLSALAWIVPVLGIVGYLQYLKDKLSTKAIDILKRYTIRNTFKPAMGIQADIQDELIKLLKIWVPERKPKDKHNIELPTKILLLIEDLDRCSEDKIIQNIDALRVMLEDKEIIKRLVIVTAVDERIIKSAIKTKYAAYFRFKEKDKEKNENVHELVSEYLDKIFISAIKLGDLTKEQKKEYFDVLAADDITEVVSESNGQNKKEAPKKEVKGHLDLAIRDGDLVIKDGDLAMEDEEGNIFSSTDLEQIEERQAVPKDGFEKLSPNEVKSLRDIVGNWPAVTPRRIAIFYYRYLLCKNLLIAKYISLGIKNQWEDEQSIMNIIKLIIHFSDLYDPEKISDQKTEIERSELANGPFKIVDIHIAKSRIHLQYLLEILELIIAY